MPHPRARRAPPDRTRRRRPGKTSWVERKLVEKILGIAAVIERKRAEHQDAGDCPAQEKAPDLATEGFDYAFIPVEEPGPPQIRRLS